MNDYHNPGEIYLCHIPYGTGHEMLKDRPAVVVSKSAANVFSGVVWVVMCTAQDHNGREGCVPVSGLERESWALCHHLYSVDKSRLGPLLARTTDEELREIVETIQRCIPAELVAEAEKGQGGGQELAVRLQKEEIQQLQTERDTIKRLYEGLLDKILRGGALHMKGNAPMPWRWVLPVKKLLERLRCWMIRKLGGYTVEYSQTIHPIKADISYRILQATSRMGNWERATTQTQELVRLARRYMCEELAEELLNSDEVIFEATDDPVQNALLIRARLFVVEGKRAALYLNTPVGGCIRIKPTPTKEARA